LQWKNESPYSVGTLTGAAHTEVVHGLRSKVIVPPSHHLRKAVSMGTDLKGKKLDVGYSQRVINERALYQKRFTYNQKVFDVYGVTLKECKQKYKEKYAKLESGVTGERTILRNYFDSWIEYRRMVGKVKESTLHHYKQLYMKHIDPRFGKRLVDSVKTKEIKQLQVDLSKKYKARTVNSVTDLMHLLYESLVNEKYVKSNPVMLETLSGNSEPDRTNSRALNEVEKQLFLNQAKEVSYYYNAIRLLFATGMRSGELRGLRWSDYDEMSGTLAIQRTASVDINNKLTMNTPKSKSSARVLPVNDEIRGIIADQRKVQMDLGYLPTEQAYMFTSVRGLVISRTMLKKAFENISNGLQKKGYDFDPISPHACRHTFITQKLYEGENQYAVKAYVGHKMNANITETVYTGVDSEKVSDMIKRRDRMDVIPISKKA